MSDPSNLTGKAVVAAWPLFGYAPGQYTFKCLECGKNSIKDGSSFGDKRAIMCLECAVIKAKEQIDRLTRELADARPREPTPEMLAAAMKADQDGMPASMKTIWMVMWGAYGRALKEKP